ncbi:hypothetical protein ACFQT0_25825 [Hymenobacter humi]|uniref:Uncharacterized protein n=1 Tax=Hymenobacter humi TaxID=1411620 RepID=A0ABW2UE97_9BACT
MAHGIIKWGGYAEVPSLSTRKQKVPTFNEAHPAFDDQVGWYSLRLNGAVGQGELVNLVYEPFSAADTKLFNAAKLPAGPEPTHVGHRDEAGGDAPEFAPRAPQPPNRPARAPAFV